VKHFISHHLLHKLYTHPNSRGSLCNDPKCDQ